MSMVKLQSSTRRSHLVDKQGYLPRIALLLVCSMMTACRNTLPPEQPSRIWEVFGRQTGRFQPSVEPYVARSQQTLSGARPTPGGQLNGGCVVPQAPNPYVAARSATQQTASQPLVSPPLIPPLPRDLR